MGYYGERRKSGGQRVKEAFLLTLALGGSIKVVSCVVSAPEPINASQASEAITAEENKPKKSTGERTGNRDCKEIKLPETPNAFRAILQAGDPNVIEPPPYTLIDARTKEEITIYDVNKLRIVQEDDKVCVDP